MDMNDRISSIPFQQLACAPQLVTHVLKGENSGIGEVLKQVSFSPLLTGLSLGAHTRRRANEIFFVVFFTLKTIFNKIFVFFW
jgi:hypothetical protein